MPKTRSSPLHFALNKLADRVDRASDVVKDAAIEMKAEAIANLEGQGRGGTPPPLSQMTTKIYQQAGEPDGSGIRNHLTVEYKQTSRHTTAILGIPDGQPTIVAKVQNDGCSIAVTDKMRGFLAAEYGIFLRATTTHIVVPPRHFWDDALKVTSERLRDRLRSIFLE